MAQTQDEQDRALVVDLRKQCPFKGRLGDDPECCGYHHAAHVIERRIAEGERLRAALCGLHTAKHCDACPDCGPVVMCDAHSRASEALTASTGD